MLDSARQFFPPEVIACLLDWMADAGMNVFHWHLTDAESFPLDWQSHIPPPVRESAAACFQDTFARPLRYTQGEVACIVRHAAQLGIEVLPEFDFPAHCDVLGRVWPDLVCGPDGSDPPERELDLSRPDTWTFVGHFLLDMMDWFSSSPRIHLGADEVVGHWPDEDARRTQHRFHDTFERHLLLAKNRTPVIWNDPVTDKGFPLSKDFIVQCWRDESALETVLARGYRAIASVSATWYVGNATPEGLRAAPLPNHPNLEGAELVWFTSQGDDPADIDWIRPLIDAAGERMTNFQSPES